MKGSGSFGHNRLTFISHVGDGLKLLGIKCDEPSIVRYSYSVGLIQDTGLFQIMVLVSVTLVSQHFAVKVIFLSPFLSHLLTPGHLFPGN